MKKNEKSPEEYSWLKNILENETKPMTEKRKAIIKAAVELFSEKGYSATSTKEIAQRAGVAEGLIFKNHQTKRDLMLWLTERIINTAVFPFVSRGIQELLAKSYKNREEFIIAFMGNRMELFMEGIPLFKIIIQEMPYQPEIRAMFYEQLQKIPLSEIINKMNIGDDSGFTPKDIIQILLVCIFGFFFMRGIIMPDLLPVSHLRDDIANMARFIDRGLPAEKKTEKPRALSGNVKHLAKKKGVHF